MGKSSGKPVTPIYLKSSMTHLSSLTIAWEKNVSGKFDTIHRADLRISDIGNLLGSDWVRVAHALDIADSDINIIKSEYPDNNGKHPDPRLRIQRQISDFFAAAGRQHRSPML